MDHYESAVLGLIAFSMSPFFLKHFLELYLRIFVWCHFLVYFFCYVCMVSVVFSHLNLKKPLHAIFLTFLVALISVPCGVSAESVLFGATFTLTFSPVLSFSWILTSCCISFGGFAFISVSSYISSLYSCLVEISPWHSVWCMVGILWSSSSLSRRWLSFSCIFCQAFIKSRWIFCTVVIMLWIQFCSLLVNLLYYKHLFPHFCNNLMVEHHAVESRCPYLGNHPSATGHSVVLETISYWVIYSMLLLLSLVSHFHFLLKVEYSSTFAYYFYFLTSIACL